MLCCCSKNGSATGAILGALVSAAAALAAASYLVSNDAPVAAETAIFSEAVFGTWDGKATGEGLPPDGEVFVMALSAGEGGAIGGTLTTTNFGAFDVEDASFNEAEKVFTCTIVNQADPNAAAGFVAVVDGDTMVGAVSTPDGDYDMTAERRKN